MTSTLDRIKARLVTARTLGEKGVALSADQAEALVEVAEAAQEMDEKGQTLSFRLRAALARLEDNQ